jgi:hypothetical protein
MADSNRHANWLGFLIQNFSVDEINPGKLLGFLQVVGNENNRLAKNGAHNRISVEYSPWAGG